MSEYQFYEFIAIDGPISDDGMKYAESCSSRAEVSPYRWRNVYNFGNFGGSVDTLLQFYDAHLYLANWGSIQLSLAFPEECLRPEDVAPYLSGGYEPTLSVDVKGNRCIVTWERHVDGGWDEWIDGDGLLDRFLKIHEELMCGDFRSLFLGWLADFDPKDWGDRDDPEFEGSGIPPIPPGLNSLSPSLRELVEKFEIDRDLVEAAASFAGDGASGRIPMEEVISSLSVSEMKTLLSRVAEGEGASVMSELNRSARQSVNMEALPVVKYTDLASKALEIRKERIERATKAREEKRKQEEAKEWALNSLHNLRLNHLIWYSPVIPLRKQLILNNRPIP